MCVRQDVLGQTGAYVVSLARIVVGFLFMLQGVATLFGVLGAFGEPAVAVPVAQWPLWWAGLIQLVGGGLVMLGLFTRPLALLCSGTMAFAYFTVHQPKGLFPIQNGGLLAVLFSWMFLLIAVVGSGPVALDALLSRHIRRAAVHPEARAAHVQRHGEGSPAEAQGRWRWLIRP